MQSTCCTTGVSSISTGGVLLVVVSKFLSLYMVLCPNLLCLSMIFNSSSFLMAIAMRRLVSPVCSWSKS